MCVKNAGFPGYFEKCSAGDMSPAERQIKTDIKNTVGVTRLMKKIWQRNLQYLLLPQYRYRWKT